MLHQKSKLLSLLDHDLFETAMIGFQFGDGLLLVAHRQAGEQLIVLLAAADLQPDGGACRAFRDHLLISTVQAILIHIHEVPQLVKVLTYVLPDGLLLHECEYIIPNDELLDWDEVSFFILSVIIATVAGERIA